MSIFKISEQVQLVDDAASALAVCEGVPADAGVSGDIIVRLLRAKYDAERILKRIHAVLDPRVRENLVATEQRSAPGLSREAALALMRTHWQDPVGFHEALAGELEIKEDEYAPSKQWRYTLDQSVVDAAGRVIDAINSGWAASELRADVSLIAETIWQDEGELVDD